MLAATRPRPRDLEPKQLQDVDVKTLERDIAILRLLRDQIVAGQHPFLSVPSQSNATLAGHYEMSTSRTIASSSAIKTPQLPQHPNSYSQAGKDAAKVHKRDVPEKPQTAAGNRRELPRSIDSGEISLRARMSAPDLRNVGHEVGNARSGTGSGILDTQWRARSPLDDRSYVDNAVSSSDRGDDASRVSAKLALSERVSSLQDARRSTKDRMERQPNPGTTPMASRSRYEPDVPPSRTRLRQNSPPRRLDSRDSRRKPLEQRLSRGDKFAKQRRSPSPEAAPSRRYNSPRDRHLSSLPYGRDRQEGPKSAPPTHSITRRRSASPTRPEPSDPRSSTDEKAKRDDDVEGSVRDGARPRDTITVSHALEAQLAQREKGLQHWHGNSIVDILLRATLQVPGGTARVSEHSPGKCMITTCGCGTIGLRLQLVSANRESANLASDYINTAPAQHVESVQDKVLKVSAIETDPPTYPPFANAVPRGHPPPINNGYHVPPPYWPQYSATTQQSSDQQEYNPNITQYPAMSYQSQSSGWVGSAPYPPHAVQHFPSHASSVESQQFPMFGSNLQYQELPWSYPTPPTAPFPPNNYHTNSSYTPPY